MCCARQLWLAVKVPIGALVNKGLTIKSGQTHVQRYLKPLLAKIEAGEIDPSFVVTHRIPLKAAPEAYATFRDKKDGCIKVVIKPGLDQRKHGQIAAHYRNLPGCFCSIEREAFFA